MTSKRDNILIIINYSNNIVMILVKSKRFLELVDIVHA